MAVSPSCDVSDCSCYLAKTFGLLLVVIPDRLAIEDLDPQVDQGYLLALDPARPVDCQHVHQPWPAGRGGARA
jgi:hypothetical protein